MNKYLFEVQTKYQVLHTFNILNIRYFTFNDEKKELLLNFGDYDHYLIDENTYESLKESLPKMLEELNLNYFVDNGRYIFSDHISGLSMSKQGYFLSFKLVHKFYCITKENYYKILQVL